MILPVPEAMLASNLCVGYQDRHNPGDHWLSSMIVSANHLMESSPAFSHRLAGRWHTRWALVPVRRTISRALQSYAFRVAQLLAVTPGVCQDSSKPPRRGRLRPYPTPTAIAFSFGLPHRLAISRSRVQPLSPVPSSLSFLYSSFFSSFLLVTTHRNDLEIQAHDGISLQISQTGIT